MSVRLRPYREHKDSGLAWLGRIPRHWEVRRNGRLFAQRNETGFSDLPILEVSLKTGVRIRDFDNSNRKQVMADRAKYKRAARGDIAYNMMRMWQGAVGVAPVEGLVIPAYVVARPFPETDTRFFAYLFRTGSYMDEVDKYSHGIVKDRNRLYWDEFKQMPSTFPPLDEQRAIANFLDAQRRALRRLIRAKRQQILQLNEEKEALIHRAVTRGLKPDVRLKQADLDWIGEVPKHWAIRQLKRLLLRMDYGTSANLGAEGSIRVLTMGHINGGEIQLPTHGSLREVSSDLLLDKNDLLFNRTNSPELVGKVGIFRGCVEDRVSFASYLVRLRIKPQHDAEWLNYLLNSPSFWSFARSQALVSLHQANLNSTRYGQLRLPIPPEEEQRGISKYVSDQSMRIDQGIKFARQEIRLLHEYRTRLIADVVTGKLDVRHLKLPALEESAEAEALEFLDEDVLEERIPEEALDAVD